MNSSAAKSLVALAKYFSLHSYEVGSEGPHMRDLYALRYQIYCLECHFLSSFAYPDGLERDEYDARSAHFSATNAEGKVAGTVRLVLSPDNQSFPYLEHCPPFDYFEPPPAHMTGEISRLAVNREYRRRSGDSLWGVNKADFKGPGAPGEAGPRGEKRVNAPLLVLGLYRQAYRYSREHNIRYWYAAMEKGLARVLAIYGFHFTPIGPERDYYGPVTPYLGDLDKLEADLAATNPDLLWWFRSGP